MGRSQGCRRCRGGVGQGHRPHEAQASRSGRAGALGAQAGGTHRDGIRGQTLGALAAGRSWQRAPVALRELTPKAVTGWGWGRLSLWGSGTRGCCAADSGCPDHWITPGRAEAGGKPRTFTVGRRRREAATAAHPQADPEGSIAWSLRSCAAPLHGLSQPGSSAWRGYAWL